MISASLISDLESLQSDAVDRLKRDLKPEARELFSQLIKHYQEHFPELKDALIVLHFNLLLSCLDRHDSPDISGIINALIDCYRDLDRPTNATLEVSKQLVLWLSQPDVFTHSVQNVSAESRDELLWLVSRDFEEPLNLRDARFTLEPNIEPRVIARLLLPIDSGLFCYALARQATNIMTLPRWMRKLYRQQLHTPRIPEEIEDYLFAFTEHFQEEDYTKAYKSLLAAFEWAVLIAPALAFEWVIGLVLLESYEELEYLSYVPSLPVERRVTLTIKLHRDFALLLAEERDAECLVLHHWQEVIALGQHHLRVIQHRHDEVSMNLREDLETKGWLRVRIAEGFIAQGDDQHAQLELQEVLTKARINTYHDPILAATALSLIGNINERAQLRDEAMSDYYLALERALPRYIFSYEDVAYLDQWFFQDEHTHQRAQQAMIGIKRSADLIRLTAHDQASADLELLYSLLTSISPALSYEEYITTSVYLGLTYAYFGDLAGAERALEAAQSHDYTPGVALSNLYLIQLRNRGDHPHIQDLHQLQRLQQGYERVLKEVEGACGGEIQRQLLLHSAMLFINQWLPRYREMEPQQKTDFERRLTAHLERAYQSVSERAARGHLCQLSMLIPSIAEVELEEVSRTLQREGLAEPVRWLMRLLRFENHPYYLVSPKGRTSQLIKDEHRMRFEQQWIERRELTPEAYQAYDRLTTSRTLPHWHQHLAQSQVALLEYFVCDEWLLISFSAHGQGVKVHQVDISKRTLEDEVIDLLSSLINNDDPDYVLADHCKALYRRLIAPFEQEIEQAYRLIISPGQALKLLPFSVLQDSQGRYLGQRLEIAISLPTARPVFSTSALRSAFSQVYHVSQCQDREMQREELRLGLRNKLHDQSFKSLDVQEWNEITVPIIDQTNTGEEATSASAIVLDAELTDVGLSFRDQQGHRESIDTTLMHTVQALVTSQAGCCVFTQSVSPYIVPDTSIKTLLTGVYGGIIHCRWRAHFHTELVSYLMAHIADGSTLLGLTGALMRLRRHAIQERYRPQQWACFELYIAQGQLNTKRSVTLDG